MSKLANTNKNLKSVYIVEDDKDIQEMIIMVLDGSNYTVNMFGSAGDFRNGLDKKTPDVILLDIMLPDGDGIEICREMKSNPLTNRIPVVLMSANKYDQASTRCAEDFISKPFNIDLFKQKVESFLTHS